MKVSVSVGGRFHAFQLARQLHHRQCLLKLLTSLPRWAVARNGAGGLPIETYGLAELMMTAGSLSGIRAIAEWAELAKSTRFDRWASSRLGPADVVHAFANFALETGRRARAGGAMTVLDRASAHVSVQRRIIEEECRRFRVREVQSRPELHERALREYDEADAIIAPSTFVRTTFVEAGVPAAKIHVVPLGVDASTVVGAKRRTGRFRVLYVGGVTLRKGIPYLLEAMRLLSGDFELVLVGVVSPGLRSLVTASRPRPTIVGPVDREQLARLYQEAAVLVLPSVEDGFGLVVLEAMACGVPVIVTTAVGASDVVREGTDGFVVPPRDPEAIADRISRLRDRPDAAAAMRTAAAERARTYSWDTYGDRIVEAYGRILESRRPVAV